MINDIAIIGAGGLGREVQWLIERINAEEETWNIIGYIDDGHQQGEVIDGYPVLGGTDYLIGYKEPLSVVCAIGKAKTRKKIIERLAENQALHYPNLIDPNAVMSHSAVIGEGNIICSGAVISVDLEIGNFNVIDWNGTVGHDASLGSFITLYPNVNVSGAVKIGNCVELGTGTQVIQGKKIAEEVIIGAGSVVIRDIEEGGTYVGVPTRKIKGRLIEGCK